MDIGNNKYKQSEGFHSNLNNETALKMFIRNILNQENQSQYNDSKINTKQPLNEALYSKPFCYQKKIINNNTDINKCKYVQPSNLLSFDINVINPSKFQIGRSNSIEINPSLNSRLKICYNYQYQYISHNSNQLRKGISSSNKSMKKSKYRDFMINCNTSYSKKSSFHFFKGKICTEEGKVNIFQRQLFINHKSKKSNYFGIKKNSDYIFNSQSNTKLKKISISVIKHKTKSLHSSRISKPFKNN